MLCYGKVWYDIVWYGTVLYGMVWYGTVLYGMVKILTSPFAKRMTTLLLCFPIPLFDKNHLLRTVI